jgi:CRP-like cAMP-binding protein
MNKRNSKNKNKKQDPILDFIFDLDIDLEEDNSEFNSTKINENYKNIENSSLVIETKPVNVEPQMDSTKLLKKEIINKKADKPKKYKETKIHKKINKRKPNKEDLELLKKLINNITTFLEKNDPKNIKEIEDYFYKNLQKKNLKRLLEININDEIFSNNIVFLINGFGYYYNPYKDLIIDFIFPYDIIYFPFIFNEKLKINILFREKSTIFLLPKSDFILKKIFHKYILNKHQQRIITELNLRNLDSYNKLLFFIYFYLKNYYKIDLKNIQDYLENNNENNIIYQLNLPIKKIANFLGISYEVIIRNIKKMKDYNIILEKENKLIVNLKELKNSFSNLENKLFPDF